MARGSPDPHDLDARIFTREGGRFAKCQKDEEGLADEFFFFFS